MKTSYNNITITIKSIVMYEKLTGHPFSALSIDNPEELIPLIYCILVSHPENGILATYDEIKQALMHESMLNALVNPIIKNMMFMKQFETVVQESNTSDTSVNDTTDNQIFMKDIVPVLVSDCNLDIDYVMNEMSYIDIQDFLKYREMKHQNELEEKRLFTFLIMSPNIDTKKKRITPETILPFPWEKQRKKEKALSELEKVQEKLKELGIIHNKEEDEKTE